MWKHILMVTEGVHVDGVNVGDGFTIDGKVTQIRAVSPFEFFIKVEPTKEDEKKNETSV